MKVTYDERMKQQCGHVCDCLTGLGVLIMTLLNIIMYYFHSGWYGGRGGCGGGEEIINFTYVHSTCSRGDREGRVLVLQLFYQLTCSFMLSFVHCIL